jgi:voltage-gated potassium channel
LTVQPITRVVLPDAPQALSSRPLLRRAFYPVVALVGAVATTIGGFVVLAGIGPIEAAYWLISPANIGIHFRGQAGPEMATKAFAVLARAGLVVVGLWLGQTVVSALFGGQITEELKRVQQERTIAELSDHVVVCGYGMFGETLAQRLDEAGHDIVVIERDEKTVVRAEREGYLVVDGDARLEPTLERAGVDSAGTVVAAVDNSNVNLQIGILAGQLAPEATLVVRVGDKMYESTARRVGADIVVIPEIMSGQDVAGEL